MEVTLAKSAGFCFGVKRAVNLVYDYANKQEQRVYTYGPIIHNEEVVKELEQLGVTVVEHPDELEKLEQGTVIIRSHGVSEKTLQDLTKYGHICDDATCPFVKKIHNHVKEHSADGDTIVIIGNKEHPEVQGIYGWSNKEKTYIVNSIEEAEDFFVEKDEKVCIVSQTTYNYNKFQELVEIISQKGYDINVINTICNATKERQTEAYELAKKMDAMIVIGSYTSSNTRKLYEICKKECANTYYIQTIDDLDVNKMKKNHSVGITAGASTPNKLIEEVQKYVRNEL